MIRFSVIIPTYNAERYLNRCLLSLKMQSYKNFQVIIVDDGSNDSSYLIAKKFVDSDSRFQYIYEENGGPASARNLGLKYSSGDYICFVDSDDEVSPDYFTKLEKLLLNDAVDILDINAIIVKEDGNKKLLQHLENSNKQVTGIEFLTAYLSKNNYLNVVPWSKVVSKKYIVSNNLYFEKRYAEDELWSHLIYIKAQRVKYNAEPIYIQHAHSKSLSSGKIKRKIENIKDQKENCKDLEKYYLTNVFNRKYLKILRSDLCHTYVATLLLNDKLMISKEDKAFCVRNAKTFKEFINVTLFLFSPNLRRHLGKIF